MIARLRKYGLAYYAAVAGFILGLIVGQATMYLGILAFLEARGLA